MSKLKPVIVVLLLVVLGGGGAFIGLSGLYEAQVIEEAGFRLASAKTLLIDTMRVEAFKMIQTISAERRNESLVAALGRVPSFAGMSNQALKTALAPVNGQLRPVLAGLQKRLKLGQLSVLSPEGLLVAQAPGNAFGKSFKGLPAVKDCLAGAARDGRYELDGKLQHVAVVPIEDRSGRSLGCLMASKTVGEADVGRMARLSGMAVALFLRKTVVASTLDETAAKALAQSLDKKNPIAFGDPMDGAPLLVDLDGKAFMANVIEIPGGTDPARLAVVVDLGARFGALADAQLMMLLGIGGLLVIGVALGLFLPGARVDEQIASLRDSVHQMAEGSGYTLDPDRYSGVYHELARDLKRVGETGRPAAHRAPETVSQILGSAPQKSRPAEKVQTDSGTLDFESLLGGGSEPAPGDSARPEPASTIPQHAPPSIPSLENFTPAPVEATPVSSPPTGQKGPRVDMPGDLANFFDEGGQMPESTREAGGPGSPWDEPEPAASPSQPGAGRRMVPPPPPLMEDIGFSSPPDLGEADDHLHVPEHGSDATVIAQVPEELLKVASTESTDPFSSAASSVPPPPTALPRPPVVATAVPTTQPASPENANFREVFEQFIQTKKKCGESVVGLTMDKFVEKLRKNSSDLRARYRCKSVKFQVYVKSGKAALKATPIK